MFKKYSGHFYTKIIWKVCLVKERITESELATINFSTRADYSLFSMHVTERINAKYFCHDRLQEVVSLDSSRVFVGLEYLKMKSYI